MAETKNRKEKETLTACSASHIEEGKKRVCWPQEGIQDHSWPTLRLLGAVHSCFLLCSLLTHFQPPCNSRFIGQGPILHSVARDKTGSSGT